MFVRPTFRRVAINQDKLTYFCQVGIPITNSSDQYMLFNIWSISVVCNCSSTQIQCLQCHNDKFKYHVMLSYINISIIFVPSFYQIFMFYLYSLITDLTLSGEIKTKINI